MGFGMLFLGLDLLGDTLKLNPESVAFLNGIFRFIILYLNLFDLNNIIMNANKNG